MQKNDEDRQTSRMSPVWGGPLDMLMMWIFLYTNLLYMWLNPLCNPSSSSSLCLLLFSGCINALVFAYTVIFASHCINERIVRASTMEITLSTGSR